MGSKNRPPRKLPDRTVNTTDYGLNFAGRVNISMMPTDSRRGLSCRALWVEMHSPTAKTATGA